VLGPVRSDCASGDSEGQCGGVSCVLSEGGDKSGGSVGVRGDSNTGSAVGCDGGDERVDKGEKKEVGCDSGVSSGGDEISAWARLDRFDRGQCSREEARFFSDGLFVGGARLWQDISRSTSLARRILADGGDVGLVGFVRWRGYDRNRRLRRLVSPLAPSKTSLSLPLRSSYQGWPSLRRSDNDSASFQLATRRSVPEAEGGVAASVPVQVNRGTRRVHCPGSPVSNLEPADISDSIASGRPEQNGN